MVYVPIRSISHPVTATDHKNGTIFLLRYTAANKMRPSVLLPISLHATILLKRARHRIALHQPFMAHLPRMLRGVLYSNTAKNTHIRLPGSIKWGQKTLWH